jgi:tRNA threonylcarbamoyladenosine biosynthesis protein TsaE
LEENLLTGYLKDEAESTRFARAFAEVMEAEIADPGFIVFLQGDLGAGKSFFARAFIQYYLPEQKVKSPTYTLVESYELPTKASNKFHKKVQHYDLYRLCSSEELEFIGVRDLLAESYCSLIEWADKGFGVLPPNPDIEIVFDYKDESRVFLVKSFSCVGLKLLVRLQEKLKSDFSDP